MIVKPAITFLRRVSDARIVSDAQNIVISMTENPAYPDPEPTLAAITVAINDFTLAITNAADGGTALTAIKNAKRAALVALLRQLAIYVQGACKGNLAVLISSGFPVHKPVRSPVGVLPAPATPVLRHGPRTGDLLAVTSPVANASTYNWRVALASAPTVPVQETTTTAARKTFEGLTPGQIYRVEVNALGSAGPSDWSNAAQLMVV